MNAPPMGLHQPQMEAALALAEARGELRLVYQPQVCLASGRLIGAEALLRWQSASLGPVPVQQLIAAAERSGLILPIGAWVIREACAQIVRWQAAGLPAIRVSVNVSPLQFQLGDVAGTVQQALDESGADPSQLGLELTESALLDDGDGVARTLRLLQARGVEIALDDFGTGYSSLSRLRTLPIDLLKIDRSFVSDVTAAPESASVTRSIINLSHGLKIPVLAEGVETTGQLNMLAANGCDRIQGFLFSPPVEVDAMAAMLRDGRCLDGLLSIPAKPARTLLLVDDEANILAALKRLFRRDGYRLLTAGSGAEALELLASHPVDVILSDQRMPGMTGVDFLRRTKVLHPDTIRMTLSGFTDLQSIIDAVNEGAVYKFMTKPWDDARLREHVAQAFAQKEMADENRRLQRELTEASARHAHLNDRLAQLLSRQSERSQLVEASAGSLRDTLDQLPVAVLAIDPDGLLAFVNRAAAGLLPEAPAQLGSVPGALIGSLRDSLGTEHGGARSAGQTVTVDRQPMRGWRLTLQGDGPPRGEVLVLVPQPVPTSSEMKPCPT